MKGKKEGEEKKGKVGRKKERKKKRKRERKIKSSTARLEPATFHSVANRLWLPPGG